jgi:large subunit ribosomal protein L5
MWYRYVVRQMLVDLLPNSSHFVNIPKMDKIVCHIGVGSATEKRSHVLHPMVLLTLLVGQKAIPCLSKKAVAGFHLREDIPIGAKVTLRKGRMDDFFLTFLVVVLPGLRDFHGVTHKSIDKVGNLTIGLADVSVFPALAPYTDMMGKKTGIQITFCCNAKTREEGTLFWKAMGVPFIL